jgi:hypothetical protein
MQNGRTAPDDLNDMTLLTQIASHAVLDAAYEWLYLRRKN